MSVSGAADASEVSTSLHRPQECRTIRTIGLKADVRMVTLAPQKPGATVSPLQA